MNTKKFSFTVQLSCGSNNTKLHVAYVYAVCASKRVYWLLKNCSYAALKAANYTALLLRYVAARTT